MNAIAASEVITRLSQEGRSRPKPETVYKFLDGLGGRLALQERTIKYTSIKYFNDPFECLPQGISESDAEQLFQKAEAVKDDIQKWNSFCDRHPTFFPPLGDLREHVRKNPRQVLRCAFEDLSSYVRDNLLLHSVKELGIASFSASKQSPIMWSHYAEKHKGIVIGYNSACFRTVLTTATATPGAELLPVRYSDERLSVPLDLENTWGLWDVLATTKSMDWKYEAEWRSVFVDKDKKMEELGSIFPTIPVRFISEINIGVSADRELKRACYVFCKMNPFCKLFQADLHATQYALDFRPLNESARRWQSSRK